MTSSTFPLTFPIKILLLGSGELGKELTISLQRLGCKVIACDSYAGAPAMQVATEYRIIDMTDDIAVNTVIAQVEPDLIVPEVEKLAVSALVSAAANGYRVVPSAKVVELTFDRQGIRVLAAERAQVPTSPYAFADSYETLIDASKKVGLPCFVKPTMSSSGHGQSRVTSIDQLEKAWNAAVSGARADTGRVIVEGQIDFDYEITLLTLRHLDSDDPSKVKTSFCAPIGHRQSRGDYVESWQPQHLPEQTLSRAQNIAKKVTDTLAEVTLESAHMSHSDSDTINTDAIYPMLGIFGVELFVQGDKVFFSELSPRPHDTGMVTMITQPQNEFDLHARAILGLPLDCKMYPQIPAGASAPLKSPVNSKDIHYTGVAQALSTSSNVQLRIFGKPEAHEGRRMAVALAAADTTQQARELANQTIQQLELS